MAIVAHFITSDNVEHGIEQQDQDGPGYDSGPPRVCMVPYCKSYLLETATIGDCSETLIKLAEQA